MGCTRSQDCVSIGYGIIGDHQPWIETVLQEIAKNHDLQLNQDIQHVYTGDNNTEFLEYFVQNDNRYDHAILFCTSYFRLTPDLNLPCSEYQGSPIYFYNLLYNISDLNGLNTVSVPRAPLPRDYVIVALKMTIDSAIAQVVSKKKGSHATPPTFQVISEDYPKLPNRATQNYDIMTDTGAFYIYIIPMLLFMTISGELAREKFYKLRLGLTVMGLSESSYWISWAAVSFLLSMLLSITIILAGMLFGFAFFLKTPFLLLLLLLTIFTFALQKLAFLMVTFSNSLEKANTYSYTFFLIGILFQIFFSKVILIDLLYETSADFTSVFFRRLFFLYPTFHFSKIFGEITMYSGSHFDIVTNTWIEGPGYTWSKLTEPQTGKLFGIKYDAPTTLASFGHLFSNIEVFVILLWYLDHVLPGNRGRADSWYFFLTPSYWGFGKKKRNNEGANQTLINDSLQDRTGLNVQGISKTFRALPCCSSRRDVRALSEVNLNIAPGELLALLGHNGAGKTTLLNVMTGLLAPDEGTVRLDELDIVNDLTAIRASLGVCPQFDILWGELTAAEHIRLLGTIKGIDKSNIEDLIVQKLKQVNLLNEKDALVRSFSGGMKRRLSLALSTVGNPRVLLLDEPTTGMDPVNRAQVWQLIKELKRGRMVLLTTHAMEEADVLADRVAVIVDGTIKCEGTSLYLKNTFGDGYRLNVVTHINKVSRLIELVTTALPHSRVFDTSAGNVLFVVPLDRLADLKVFFRVVEGKFDVNEHPKYQELKSLIIDYGLSHTTLEEVFMSVTGKKETRKNL
eukprot:TRINITY_DN9592_c0_g1_i1.p1 TRINITY_DN9592_c0_g1~~TRINITY_DN9592_c0_g1_i1.p1  ORF type:complete len:794 (-),score=85.85 TRINITY_DN9592_c0_g1_i1:221-2602(-)